MSIVAAGDVLRIAVVGAHLEGMPLNGELTARGATFAEKTRTAGSYRLYALAGTVPPKPGLARAADGAPIEVELWDMPLEEVGGFLAGIPAPLGLGSLELEDGRIVTGFICEGHALAKARDITDFGGWRAYVAAGPAHGRSPLGRVETDLAVRVAPGVPSKASLRHILDAVESRPLDRQIPSS